MTDLVISEVTGAEPDDLCAVLRAGYEEDRFTDPWFRWKHLEGPWGPSRAFRATLDEEVVGLAFTLPWRYCGPGGSVAGMRYVDGLSLPTARGKGVFNRTVAFGLRAWEETDPGGVVVATATLPALRSHVRNGAVAVPPVTPAYVVLGARPARLVTDPAVADTVEPAPGWSTDWDGDSLRWRFDPESGYGVSFDALASSDGPTGAVTRVVARGPVRTLVVECAWGARRERAALIRAVAWREKAVVLLGIHGEGSDPVPGRALSRRPPTLLAVWDQRPARHDDLAERSAWSLDLATVGGAV